MSFFNKFDAVAKTNNAARRAFDKKTSLDDS